MNKRKRVEKNKIKNGTNKQRRVKRIKTKDHQRKTTEKQIVTK